MRVSFRPDERDGGGAFQLPDEGVYQAIITDTEDTISKTSKKPMCVLHLELQGSEPPNYKVREYLVEGTGFFMEKVAQILASIGKDPEAAASFDTDQLHGKLCTVRIKHDPYNGKTYAKVDEFLAPEQNRTEAPAPTAQDDDIPF